MAAVSTSMYPVTTKPWGDLDGVIVTPGGVVWCLTSRGPGGHITPETPSLVPCFSVKGAAGYVEFLERAFGATEVFMHKSPEGEVLHCRMRIGDSILGGSEMEPQTSRGHDRHEAPFLMHMYVPDVDAVYASALAAGATSVRGLEDAPYGDRTATVADAYGNMWSLATHVKDVKF